MFLIHHKLVLVTLHTLVIYGFLIVMLRVIGRRQLGQLTVLDVVIIILLGSAVETAMVNGDTTLQAGLVCAGTLLIVNWSFGWMFARSKRLRHLVSGGPVLLVHNGHFVEEHLRRVGLTAADVLEALREHEEPGIENIKFAVLEMDGEINVVPRGAGHHHSAPVPSRHTVNPSSSLPTPSSASRPQANN